MGMDFHWRDYTSADAELIDQLFDTDAAAMTGIDSDWDMYWNEVIADAVNYPGCMDFCKIVSASGVPVAAVVFGCYRGEAAISEIVVAPFHRAKVLARESLKNWLPMLMYGLTKKSSCFEQLFSRIITLPRKHSEMQVLLWDVPVMNLFLSTYIRLPFSTVKPADDVSIYCVIQVKQNRSAFASVSFLI